MNIQKGTLICSRRDIMIYHGYPGRWTKLPSKAVIIVLNSDYFDHAAHSSRRYNRWRLELFIDGAIISYDSIDPDYDFDILVE